MTSSLGDEVGITIRVERHYDAWHDRWIQRIGRVCECGHMIPYFVQIMPLDTDWDNDPD